MKVIRCLQLTLFLALILTLAQTVQAACTASGQVIDLSGHGVHGVSIQYCILNAQGGCSTGLVPFAETDTSGNFSGPIICAPPFVHLDYRFFTSAPCYQIAPYSITRTGYTGGAITGLDYSADMYTYHISGRVADVSGTGIGGVSMVGNYVITDSLGNYSAGVACGASFTFTPNKACYAFTPSSISYTEIRENYTDQNYTGNIVIYTVSGYVKTAAGAGLEGVTMKNLPGNPVTNASGFYSAAVPCGWAGSVYPEKPGLTFTPAEISYQSVHSDQTSQNYSAKCAFSIYSRGYINGLGGSWTITQNVTANPADCNWSISGVPTWITINTGASGTGNGTIGFTIAANPGAGSLLADLRVGDAQSGATFWVAQNGQGCTFTFTPPTATYTKSGGSGTYNISTQETCFWDAGSSQPSWLTVSSITAADASFGNGFRIGSGAIGYAVSANDGDNSRSAHIGYPRSFSVTQGGILASMPPVWIVGTVNYFATLQEAHDGAGSGNTIKAKAVVFAESLAVGKNITIIGGYDSDYAVNGGYSTIGGLTVNVGSLTVERLVIR
jgi:hypothetical protein